MPPIPAAMACEACIPSTSPTPVYKPSILRMSTMAREARETASCGGKAVMGTPQTPMPTLGCTGILASAMQGLMSVQARAVFQATDGWC